MKTSSQDSVKRHSFLGQRGDTLVEVMLAIAILSSVLAGCYSITRRALRISQASQDRIYGLKIVEGQIEMMRKFREIKENTSWTTTIDSVAGAGNGGRYCFDVAELMSSTTTFGPKSYTESSACAKSGPPDASERYRIVNKVEQSGPASATSRIYVFRVEWEAINGGGEPIIETSGTKYYDNVEYRYKLYDLQQL
jgi:prepilin-type N-terminal cleavage/methylation domain-containing protein